MWRPEAPGEPYAWLAAFGGHLAVGVGLWLPLAWLGPLWAAAAASAIYAGWEIMGARRWGLLWWDSALDWTGVTFGALTAAGLWTQSWPLAAWCCVSCIVIAAAGAAKRN